MDIDELEFLLVLLYIPGKQRKTNEKIRGITRLDKLIFLIQKKIEINFYNFVKYDFGPWSGEIQSDIRLLREGDLVDIKEEELKLSVEIIDRTYRDENVNTVEIYSLTEAGEKVAKDIYEKLSANVRENISEIKNKFNHIPLTDLLKYVYLNYPEMTTKSKILDKITKLDLYGKRPELVYKIEDED